MFRLPKVSLQLCRLLVTCSLPRLKAMVGLQNWNEVFICQRNCYGNFLEILLFWCVCTVLSCFTSRCLNGPVQLRFLSSVCLNSSGKRRLLREPFALGIRLHHVRSRTGQSSTGHVEGFHVGRWVFERNRETMSPKGTENESKDRILQNTIICPFLSFSKKPSTDLELADKELDRCVIILETLERVRIRFYQVILSQIVENEQKVSTKDSLPDLRRDPGKGPQRMVPQKTFPNS